VKAGAFFVLLATVAAMACGSSPPLAGNPPENNDDPKPIAPKSAPTKHDTTTRRPRMLEGARVTRAAEGKALDNGLFVARIPAEQGELAHLELAIEAGAMRDPQGKAGLAELTAYALRAADSEAEVPFDEVLDDLGAELHVEVSDRIVRFVGSCPPAALDELVATTLSLVTRPAATPAIVEREISRVQQLRKETAEQRLREWQIRTAVGSERPSPSRVIHETEPLTARDVLLFQTSYYRPQIALLAFSSPAEDKQLLADVAKTMGRWKKGGNIPEPKAGGTIPAVSYAKDDRAELAELIALVHSPAPELSGRGQDEVAWQVVCMDGFAGILERRFEAAELPDGFGRVEDIEIGRLTARALIVKVAPARAKDAMDAVREAFREAATTAPSDADVDIARRRAMLAWDRRMAAPGRRIRTFVDGFVAGRDYDLDKTIVSSIREVDRLELPDVVRERMRPAFLIRAPGNVIPDGARLITDEHRSETKPERPERLDLPDAERARLRDQVLARAYQAVGGKDALRELQLLRYDAFNRYEAAMPFVDAWTIAMAGGDVVRDRRILGTSIKTRANGDKVTEVVGASKRELRGDEAALFHVEARIHPIVLLRRLALAERPAARLVGKVRSGDRELLVLEVPLPGDRMVHLAIDGENGLPRRVEYDEWRPSAPPQRVQLLFRNYAKAAGPVTGKPAQSRGLFPRVRVPRLVYRYVEGRFVGEADLYYR